MTADEIRLPAAPGPLTVSRTDQAGQVASYQREFMAAPHPVDRAVDEPVDKHHSLGRTRRVLWMNCGRPKNLGTGDRILLCGPRPRA